MLLWISFIYKLQRLSMTDISIISVTIQLSMISFWKSWTAYREYINVSVTPIYTDCCIRHFYYRTKGKLSGFIVNVFIAIQSASTTWNGKIHFSTVYLTSDIFTASIIADNVGQKFNCCFHVIGHEYFIRFRTSMVTWSKTIF